MIIWMEEDSGLGEDTKAILSRAADLCLEAEGIGEAEPFALSLTLADEEEIRRINRDFRGIDRVTDVLSFPQFEGPEEIRQAIGSGFFRGEDPDDAGPEDAGGEATEGAGDVRQAPDEEIPLGDVVVCRERIVRQAEEYGHSEKREMVYLFVHSVLHLLGYDHMNEDEKKRMRAREEEIMTALGIGREE